MGAGQQAMFMINPFVFGGGGSWGGSSVTPDSVTGLAGWWKADAITGKSNNDPMDEFLNSGSGGTGYDFVQITSGKRPLYKTGGPNGLPYLLFDGSNDDMETRAQAPMNDGTSTVIAVINPTSPPTNAFKCVLSTRKYDLYYATDTNAFGSYPGQTVVGNALPASGTWAILAIVVRAYNDVDLYSLGVKVTRTNGTSLASAIWNFLGSGIDGLQQFMNGLIGEVCWYDSPLSESDVRNVATGLVTKWSAV